MIQTTKGATTKSFFSSVAQKLKLKINPSPNYTTLITCHGNIKSYLHKFKIIDNPICPCKAAEQTADHLIFDCTLLAKERDALKTAVLKFENWPVTKNKLISVYNTNFSKFVNSLNFETLQ